MIDKDRVEMIRGTVAVRRKQLHAGEFSPTVMDFETLLRRIDALELSVRVLCPYRWDGCVPQGTVTCGQCLGKIPHPYKKDGRTCGECRHGVFEEDAVDGVCAHMPNTGIQDYRVSRGAKCRDWMVRL